MNPQKDKIIQRLKKYNIEYEIVKDNLIKVFLLYIEVDIVMIDGSFKLEYVRGFISKNFKKDLKRLRSVLKERRIVRVIQPLEYFENKYGIKKTNPKLHFIDASINQNDIFEIAQLIKLSPT